MKNLKSLFLLVSVFLLALTTTSPARAEVIDPIGNDQWTYLNVTIIQEDRASLPNQTNEAPSLTVYFGSKTKTIDPRTILPGQPRVISLRVPATEVGGRYKVVYNFGDDIDAEYNRGTIATGTKDITLTLKRIDINHMRVTREDGTQYDAKGNYRTKITFTNNTVEEVNRYSVQYTGTGFVAPKGLRYSITVEAETEDGKDSYSRELDFRTL